VKLAHGVTIRYPSPCCVISNHDSLHLSPAGTSGDTLERRNLLIKEGLQKAGCSFAKLDAVLPISAPELLHHQMVVETKELG
jgi:hypothetical protein